MSNPIGSIVGGALHRKSERRIPETGNDPADMGSAAATDRAAGSGARFATVNQSALSHLQLVARHLSDRIHRSSSLATTRKKGSVPPTTREAGGYRISGFTHQDAADIPRAFEKVYGRDYLNLLVYDVGGFAARVASGDQISFVSRDAEGNFAGHLALAFSAPNQRLVEVSQGIVLPTHRKSGIFARLMDRAVAFARDELGAQAVFGEALTNHTVSQRVLAACEFRAVGLEVDYVPQRMLLRERAHGPAATLVQYLDLGGHEHAPCHLPPSHAAWFARLLDGAAIYGPRQIAFTTRPDRRASVSEARDMPRYDMSRLLIRRAGFDFWSLLNAHETEARVAGRRTFQVLVNLGNAEGAATVELLRSCGYACGGLLPGYFEGGQHVAIMFRSFKTPYFEGVKLHDCDGEQLLANVVTDWQRVERRDSELQHGFDGGPVETLTHIASPPLWTNAGAKQTLPGTYEHVHDLPENGCASP